MAVRTSLGKVVAECKLGEISMISAKISLRSGRSMVAKGLLVYHPYRGASGYPPIPEAEAQERVWRSREAEAGMKLLLFEPVADGQRPAWRLSRRFGSGAERPQAVLIDG